MHRSDTDPESSVEPSGRLPADRVGAALTAVTGVLLVVGASVRVNGAGLACPDWPLCFGEVVPPIDVQVGFEFGHRVLAGAVSLGFLGLGALVARRGRAAVTLWGLAAVVLGVQVVLGGLTVLHLLAEWTVASHLLAGNTFCSLLLLLTLLLRSQRVPERRAPVGGHQRVLAGLLLALVPLQLLLGGFVAGSHAGLVCPAFPGCGTTTGAWFPSFSGLLGLQVTHRLVAWILLGVALVNVAASRARLASVAVLGAVLAQATIGVANVLLRLPVEVTLLHSAGAALVAWSTVWLNWDVWRAPLHAAVPSAPGPRADRALAEAR